MSRLNQIGAGLNKSKYAAVVIGANAGHGDDVAQVSVEALQIDAEMILCEGLESVICSLEAIGSEAQASIEHGGLDRQAAGMMEVSVEGILNRVGLSASNSIPSLESFGGTGARVEATQVSVEGIKEKAKELWAFLVKKFKDIREKIFMWFKKVFSSAAGLKKRAEGVAKKATEKKGTKKDSAEDDLKLGSAANALYIGDAGKVDVAKLGANVKTLKDAVESVYRGHGKFLSEMAGAASKVLDKAAGLGKDEMEGSDVKAFYDGGKFLGEDVTAGKFEAPKGEFLGGREFVVSELADAPADMTGLKSALDKYSVDFAVKKDSADKAPKVADDQTFAAINPDGVKDIAENVVVLAEAILAFESDYFKHQKTIEGADKSAEKAGANFGKFTLGAPAAAADKVCRSLYSAVQRANQAPVNSLTSASMASAKAALDVCDKSLSQYE